MKLIYVMTGKTKTGAFKAYLWGQADMHVCDWRGSNYRTRAIPGQPLRGYKTRAEADSFARRRFSTLDDAHDLAGRIGDGTHLNDPRYKTMEAEEVRLLKAEAS